MSSKKCLTRVSHKSVKQECPIRALRNSVKQGCPTRVSPQCVNSGCLTSEFVGNGTNKYCLCLSTYVSAFGFVGFILFFLATFWDICYHILETTFCSQTKTFASNFLEPNNQKLFNGEASFSTSKLQCPSYSYEFLRVKWVQTSQQTWTMQPEFKQLILIFWCCLMTLER